MLPVIKLLQVPNHHETERCYLTSETAELIAWRQY